MIARRAAALALALACAAAGPGIAEPARLSPEALRALAYEAEAAGARAAAAAMARALLARDPADVAARIVLSRVARAAGDDAAARREARAAWAAAATPRDRHAAALARAQALSAGGRPTAAMFWLRRAADLAPDPAARAAAARDLASVRERNPLRAELTLSVAPSSNVNNGSRHDTITLAGAPFVLSPAARALAGGVVATGLRLGLRVQESAASRTELTLAGALRQVWISDPAGAGVDPGAFSQVAAEAGVEHRRRPGGGPVQVTLSGGVGRTWHGGAPLSDALRVELAADRPLPRGRHGRVALGIERQWRLDDARRSAVVVALRGAVQQRLAAGDRLRLEGLVRATFSDAAEVSHAALALRAGWERAAPLAGLRLGATLGVEARDFGPVPLAPGGRRDLRLEAGLALTFERASWMGFAPVLDLRAARTLSTLPLHDGVDLGVGLGFRSLF